ncbi:MAG: hypothetical protein QM703_25690 [Gemmatales bacterium]
MNLTLKLPKRLQDWVQSQADSYGLENTEAYINRLIREEQKRQAVAHLVKKLDEAEQSGPAVELNLARWKEREAALFSKLNNKRPKSRIRKNAKSL